MNVFEESNHEFWNNLAETKTREELLELIEIQNPDLIPQINRVEWVFRNKLSHLTWKDGTPVTERPFTNRELSYLIDPIFEPKQFLLDMDISAVQQKNIHTAADTVLWAKHFLKQTPRVYQILMLRNPNRFKVLRSGRRLGKRLDVHTPIMTTAGWSTMGDLKEGDKVFDENGKPCNVTYTSPIRLAEKSYKLIFSDGSEILADADHEWVVDTKASRKALGRAKNPVNKPIKVTTQDMLDMGLKTKVYTSKSGEAKFETSFSIRVAGALEHEEKNLPIDPYILGLYLGDGGSSARRMTTADKEVVVAFELAGYTLKHYRKYDYIVPMEFWEKYKNLGIAGKGNKRIPELYLTASVAQREALLKGLMDSDGYCDPKTKCCEFSQKNKDLAYDAKTLIESLGYRAQIREDEAKLYGVSCGSRYRISFTPWRSVFSLYRKRINQETKKHPSGWQKHRYILDIVPVEPAYMRCIEVDSESHLYLAGTSYIPTHNTYTMALKLMHYSYVNKNGRSIVLAPMQAQATLIFEEVMKLAANSPEMKEAIVRDKKSPPAEINLSNGSIIRFFTTGMKTASKSDSTRGQEAHLIVLDELDYMGDDDLEAVLAMMQKTDENQPDKQLIGASTPTGRRSIFWQWCTDPDSAFSEFWFPSYANPFFDKETEDMLRNEYTETGWRHEIEADWGEDVQGVYPRRYLDQAFSAFEPWEYDLYPDPVSVDQDSFFVFGVDWDKYGAGTNLVVLQVFGKSPIDPSMKNKVRMFYREEVARDEYTFVNATRRIIELNDLLKPRHIYIDRGAGETQAEMLHLYGKDNKASGLHKKVRGVQFSENVEVRDPYTKELVKKPVKPYMVDNLRMMLERKQIFFPEHDEELYMQLISYVVVRESEAGKPVFEMSSNRVEDHAHDALILACLGITENYGDLHNVKVDFGSIAFNSSFLMPEQKKVDTIVEEKEDRKDGKVPFTLKRSLSSKTTRGGRGHITRSTF